MKQALLSVLALLMLSSVPGWADGVEDIKAVADDTRFEHIHDQLHYRPSGFPVPETRYADPPGGNANEFWIKFFIRNEPWSGGMPTAMAEALDNAPAHLAQIDAMSRSCNAEYFQRDMNNYRTYVIEKVQLELTRSLELQIFYENNYRYHRAQLAELIPSTEQAWVSVATAKKAYKVYSTTKGAHTLYQSAINGVAAAPPTPFSVVGLVWTVWSTTKEIVGYQDARLHAVRALANMKMSMLYEYKVIPFLEDMIGLYRHHQSLADQRFSSSYCHQCRCVIGSTEHPGATGTGPSCTPPQPPAKPAPRPAPSPPREPRMGPHP